MPCPPRRHDIDRCIIQSIIYKWRIIRGGRGGLIERGAYWFSSPEKKGGGGLLEGGGLFESGCLIEHLRYLNIHRFHIEQTNEKITSFLVLEKIFHSFALFFNNQREIPYLRSAMQYLLCIQHALREYPEKNIRDTLRQVHCRSVVITNLQSSHTTAHNLLNYFSPELILHKWFFSLCRKFVKIPIL